MPFVLQDCGCADRVQSSAAASWAEEGGAAGLACGRLFASARIWALWTLLAAFERSVRIFWVEV